MTTMPDFTELEFARADLVYHQARVLLLVDAVAAAPGHSGKLDGMTKLAKLDFLVRYPGLGSIVLDRLDPEDPRLHLAPTDRDRPTAVEAPMVRYKYGPWDHRYYAVIGALVGRGLVQYSRAAAEVSLSPPPPPVGARRQNSGNAPSGSRRATEVSRSRRRLAASAGRRSRTSSTPDCQDCSPDRSER